MHFPRSRLAWLAGVLGALVAMGVMVLVIVRISGRSRLERALEDLRASGGPELPPQTSGVTAGGARTVAWFAQFDDEKAWERGELASARSIDAFLAEHGSELGKLAVELRTLADALRIRDEELAAKRKELEHPPKWEKELIEGFGAASSPDALADLEYERSQDVQDAAQEQLLKQVPIESWDAVSRAWILTRGLGHSELIRRAPEIAALEPFDPPTGRGFERYSIRVGRASTSVLRALLDALPAQVLRGDTQCLARCAQALIACGRLYSHGWGLTHLQMDAWIRMQVATRVLECLQFVSPDVDLREYEESLAGWDLHAEALEGWKRERAVGNEFFAEFRNQTTEATRVVDGLGWVEREALRLWLDHEQAGYLELLGRAIELAPRAPFELSGGIKSLDEIGAELRSPRPWHLIRSMITPNFRSQAARMATCEVQRQMALLCIAAWRDRGSLAPRLAATRDPFTGKPFAMREEGGVLVLTSPGDGGEPIEVRLRAR